MTVPARKFARAPRMALTEAALMRLVRFPAVRRAISLGLERATPEKVSVPADGAFIRFRLEDPGTYHPALFSTIHIGKRGTLAIIGTRRDAVKKKAALDAFLRRMGWNASAKRWKRNLSSDERRSLIYQLRTAGIIGGSRTQAILVPRARVDAVAARFLGKTEFRKVAGANPFGAVGTMVEGQIDASGWHRSVSGAQRHARAMRSQGYTAGVAPLTNTRANPMVYHRGVPEDRLGGIAVYPHPSTVGDMKMYYTKGGRQRRIMGVSGAEMYDSPRAAQNPILATLGIANPGRREWFVEKDGRPTGRSFSTESEAWTYVAQERSGGIIGSCEVWRVYPKGHPAISRRKPGVNRSRKTNPLTRTEAGRTLRWGRRRLETASSSRWSDRKKAFFAGAAVGAAHTVREHGPRAAKLAAERIHDHALARQNPGRPSTHPSFDPVIENILVGMHYSVATARGLVHIWREGRSYAISKAHLRDVRAAVRRARAMIARKNPVADTSSELAKNNPGVQTINVPFRNGQKVTPAEMRRWLQSLPAGPVKRNIVARFEKGIGQYKKFHLGSEPRFFTYRAVPMGSSKAITDVDMVVSEGKEWAATYQVPRHSGKYETDGSDGRYIHAHGDSDLNVDIKRSVRRGRLPERFHTADGKFVGVIPTSNVKITDWYRG